MPKTTTKKAPKTKRAKTRTVSKRPNPDEYHERVAFEAYLMAEKRDFVGGDPFIDWIGAEEKVNKQLNINQ